MAGAGFVICEAGYVKREFPEFQKTLADLEARMIGGSSRKWPGFTFGGMTPTSNQFGRTNILPKLFADENNDVLDKNHVPTTWGVNSFRQLFTSTSPAAVAIPGWKTILQGSGLSTTPEDIRIAWAGLMIPDPTIVITKIRWQIGDTIYPVLDIEEVQGYSTGAAIIFEEGFEIDEETVFLLKGFFEATGYQRVIPLGFIHYKRKDFVMSE